MSNSSIIEGIGLVMEKFASTAIETSTFDIWTCLLFSFAFIGFVSLMYSISQNVFKAIGLIFYGFVLIPLIFIVSLSNRKKRQERLKEWREVTKNLTGKDKWKFWIFMIIKILVPTILFLAILWWELF